MSEMVERVARAMYELQPVGAREWRDCPTREASGLREQARAAIAAMREPTEEMVSAAIAPYRHANTVEFDAIYRKTVRGYVAAMADAALASVP